MNEQNPSRAIPHPALLDEIQVGMLAVVHQLPIVTSMLKWAQSAINGKNIDGPMGWMLVVDPTWTNQDQIDHLTALRQSVHELNQPLQSLFTHIGEFSEHKQIEKAISSLYNVYKDLPIIEPEMQLLSLGHNIFENKELIPHFIQFTEQVSKLQERGSNLKHILVREVINRLSISLDDPNETRFSDLEGRLDDSL